MTSPVPTTPVTIRIRENGPYFIAAEEAPLVTLVDAAGNVVQPTPGKGVALCRCGASSKKPFCDGTHKTNGFDGSLKPPAPPAL